MSEFVLFFLGKRYTPEVQPSLEEDMKLSTTEMLGVNVSFWECIFFALDKSLRLKEILAFFSERTFPQKKQCSIQHQDKSKIGVLDTKFLVKFNLTKKQHQVASPGEDMFSDIFCPKSWFR